MCLRQFIFLKHSSEGQWLLENETLKKKFLYAIILKYLKNRVFCVFFWQLEVQHLSVYSRLAHF